MRYMLATNSTKPSARSLAVDILQNVFTNGVHTDAALAGALKRSPLNENDRSLLIELVNGTIRWRGQLDWMLAQFVRGDFPTIPLRLRCILEVSLYQIKFLDRVPAYAAVSEGVELAKRSGGKAWARLVNGVLRTYLRNSKKLTLPALDENPVKALAIRYSHPEWMIERWLPRFGLEETERLCECNNRRPAISVRVNLARTSRECLLEEFAKAGIQASPSKFFGDFIILQKPDDIGLTELFQRGLFAIQDESTAIPCMLLSPKRGEVILDLCAAPGGKTCYLAHLAGDETTIIAADSNPSRLQLLQQNVKRLQLQSIFPVLADGRNLSLRSVDKILLDAPCSGLGVLSRRADLRWKRKPSDIKNVQKLQKALLENADRLLKPGGTLVYSTCTIELEENEEMIRDFLSAHQNYIVEADLPKIDETFLSKEGFFRSLPQQHEMDGSFAVKLIKTK